MSAIMLMNVRKILRKTGVSLDEHTLDLSGMAHTWLESLRTFKEKSIIRSLSLSDHHIQERDVDLLLRELARYLNLVRLNLQFSEYSLVMGYLFLFGKRNITC